MKRTLTSSVAVGGRWRSARRSFAQSVPEINYDANADILSLPSYGEVAGVATNSRGHVFVYARTGHAVATLGDERTFYHGGSRLFQFDPDRQVREGDRPGRLRGQLRAAGARRSAGQHLDRRRRLEPGREVRCRRAVPAGARPQAREHHAAARSRRAGAAARRGVSRDARRRAGGVAAAVVAAAVATPAGRPAPASTATASTVRPT